MTLEKELIQSMALKNTAERAGTCHGTGERADTSLGTRGYWTKG